MEIIFIRHGHGEHLLDYPNMLNKPHPALTERGIQQVKNLREQLQLDGNHLMVASPTKRTIQTAQLLAGEKSFAIAPQVGPRIFPAKTEGSISACDIAYTKEELMSLNINAELIESNLSFGKEDLIRMSELMFQRHAIEFIEWCRERYPRIVIVSHDGTITSYRIALGEKGLTREDFLGEAGVYSKTV